MATLDMMILLKISSNEQVIGLPYLGIKYFTKRTSDKTPIE